MMVKNKVINKVMLEFVAVISCFISTFCPHVSCFAFLVLLLCDFSLFSCVHLCLVSQSALVYLVCVCPVVFVSLSFFLFLLCLPVVRMFLVFVPGSIIGWNFVFGCGGIVWVFELGQVTKSLFFVPNPACLLSVLHLGPHCFKLEQWLISSMFFFVFMFCLI